MSNMPLTGPPPAEVPLSRSPLVRVIAQVRFPLIMSIENPEFIAGFQEAIRPQYPILRSEKQVVPVPGPIASIRPQQIWRFEQLKGNPWRATLSPEFLALETADYTSRADFLDHWNILVTALHQHLRPAVIDRLGIRYVDRLIDDQVGRVPDLFRAEVAGILATELGTGASLSICENVFELPDEGAQMRTRWGLLPSRATIDPSTIEPLENPSWLLDVDAFDTTTQGLDPENIMLQSRKLCERIYSMFRWAITDEGIRHFGGKI